MKKLLSALLCVFALTAVSAGNYTTSIIPLPGPGYAIAAKIADFNGDGWNDVLVVAAGSDAASCQTLVYIQDPSNPGILNQPLVGSYPFDAVVGATSVDVGDLDGDGSPDAVLAVNNDIVLLHNDAGVLSIANTVKSGIGRCSLKLEDLNGDDLSEIIVRNEDDCLGIFRNSGNFNFEPFGIFLAGATNNRLAIGDINTDGLQDVVVMCGTSSSIAIFYQTETDYMLSGTPQIINVGFVPKSLAVGQFNDAPGDDIAVIGSYSDIDDKLAVWDAQNLNGNPTVSLCTKNTAVMKTGDFDLDGTEEILSAHNNLGLLSFFWSIEPIVEASSSYSYTDFSNHSLDDCLDVSDMNNDAMPDIVLADSSKGLVTMISYGVTGIEKNAPASLGIYPNPTAGAIYFSLPAPETIRIFSLPGSLLKEQKMPAGNNFLDLSSYPSGVYILKTGGGLQSKIVRQ